MLVFLSWFAIVISILILIAILLILFLNIKIEINKLVIKYSDINYDNTLEFIINIKGYLFNFIKIFNIKIDKEKVEKYFKKKSIIKLYRKILINEKFDIKIIDTAKKYIKKYKIEYNKQPIKVEKVNLNMEIGLINIETTSYLIALISIVLSIPIAFLGDEKYKYKIYSRYEQNNFININVLFESIITINLKHIINIILKIIVGRVKKNGGTSYRRTNEYSYEQY